MNEVELLMKIVEEYKQDLGNAMIALNTAKNYIANIKNGNMKNLGEVVESATSEEAKEEILKWANAFDEASQSVYHR